MRLMHLEVTFLQIDMVLQCRVSLTHYTSPYTASGLAYPFPCVVLRSDGLKSPQYGLEEEGG